MAPLYGALAKGIEGWFPGINWFVQFLVFTAICYAHEIGSALTRAHEKEFGSYW